MTNSELRGIARMTNVVPPLQQMGRLTAEVAVTPSQLVRSQRKRLQETGSRGPDAQETRERAAVRSKASFALPTFFAGSAAVGLIVGAVMGLSSNVGASFGNARSTSSALAWGAKLSEATDVAAPESALRDGEVANRDRAHEIEAAQPAAVVPPGPREAITTVARAQTLEPLEPISAGLSQNEAAISEAVSTVSEDKTEPKLIEPLYTAVVSGLPGGSRISMGMQLSDSEWVLALNDLKKAEITVPGNVKKPMLARVAISDEDGGALAKFPLAVDRQGRIKTDTVAPVAGTPDRAVSSRPVKAAKAEPPPTSKAAKGQKAESVPKPAKRKASPIAFLLGAQIFQSDPEPDPASSVETSSEEDEAVTTPVATLTEGSAGLETFKTFTIHSAQ